MFAALVSDGFFAHLFITGEKLASSFSEHEDFREGTFADESYI